MTSQPSPPPVEASDQPLVSVVIIFFNAKKETFFEEAIESVFAQTYENWELLLADDGSTDASSAIARACAQQHPGKVRYLAHANHANRGMSATRNLGIRHAKGRYIAFLDADDLWLPHKLSEQIALLEANPEAVMIYGKTQFWFSWHPHNPVPHFSLRGETDADPLTLASVDFDQVISPPTQLLHYLRNRHLYPCSCSMVMRREIFEQLGGFEEQFRDANEDMVFHSKVFLNFPVYVSSQCWDRYRMHPDSYWRTAWRAGRGHETEMAGRLRYLTWLESYLRDRPPREIGEIGEISAAVHKALQQALFPFRHPHRHRWQQRLQKLQRGVKRLWPIC